MDWQVLIIPMIALGVWIIGTVFGKTEQPPVRRPTRMPSDRPRPAAPAGSDLDRFLEETRLRREAAAQRQEPPPAIPVPRPTPRSEPSRASRPQAERRPSKQRENPRPQPQIRREPLQPERRERSERAAKVIETIAVAEAAEVIPVESYKTLTKAATAAPMAERRTASIILDQVINLLRTPRGAGTAIVLREILDRPLCHRRRR